MRDGCKKVILEPVGFFRSSAGRAFSIHQSQSFDLCPLLFRDVAGNL